MKQAIITKNGQATHKAQLPEAELQAWLNKHIAMETFGKAEHQVEDIPAVIDENGVQTVPAVLRTVPAEYSVEIVDVTQQVEQDAINAEAQAFLDSSDWRILKHYREQALGIPTSLSSSEYLALEQERADAAARIVR